MGVGAASEPGVLESPARCCPDLPTDTPARLLCTGRGQPSPPGAAGGRGQARSGSPYPPWSSAFFPELAIFIPNAAAEGAGAGAGCRAGCRATWLRALTHCVRLRRRSERSPTPFPFLAGPPEGMRSGAKPAFRLPRVLEVKLSWSVSRLLTPDRVCAAPSSTLGWDSDPDLCGDSASRWPPSQGGAGVGT